MHEVAQRAAADRDIGKVEVDHRLEKVKVTVALCPASSVAMIGRHPTRPAPEPR